MGPRYYLLGFSACVYLPSVMSHHSLVLATQRETRPNPFRIVFFFYLGRKRAITQPVCTARESDIAWSGLIGSALVFNCLLKTDGCWVTYSSIAHIQKEKLRGRHRWRCGGTDGVPEVGNPPAKHHQSYQKSSRVIFWFPLWTNIWDQTSQK